MKVVHLCQSADRKIGGSLVVARALAEAQNTLGIDAWLVYVYGSDQDLEARDGAKQLFLSIDRSRRYTSGIKSLIRTLRELRPDVIHHHDGLLWPRLATARLGMPLVTHGHLGSPKSWWLSFSQLTHRYILKHTHRLIAISDWVAESWIASGYPPEKIRLVLNGVDSDRFQPRSLKERHEQLQKAKMDPTMKVLLWVGRLDRYTKGLDRLLLVVKHLPPDWFCLVAGDGPDRSWLTDEIGAMGKQARQVVMLGKVDDPEVWFGIADVFLFTSKTEPFGLVLLEAAVSELRILSFRCEGGGMDLLDALGANIISDDEVINLPGLLAKTEKTSFAKHSRRLVQERFSWHRAAKKTIDVYQELVNA